MKKPPMEITIRGAQGAGKSTTAKKIAKILNHDGFVVKILDDDREDVFGRLPSQGILGHVIIRVIQEDVHV